ncbi:MAG: hypothetical protein ACJAUP_001085 [Cellvibrionaceae bacterium]|jgi:hypothetical protein
MINKFTLLFTLSIICLSTANADVIRLSEPVQKDATTETYGEPLSTMPQAVELKVLLTSPEEHLSKSFSVTTQVAKVCQKKGCFFIAQEGSEIIRVAFKDYGFFVPTDIGGKTVTLVGELVAHQRTAKQATHFSKDLGQSSALESGFTYEIVATSVRIPIN